MRDRLATFPPKWMIIATLAYAIVWLTVFTDWRYGPFLPSAVHWFVFGLSMPISLAWVTWAKGRERLALAAVLSVGLVFWWQFAVFATDQSGLAELRTGLANTGLWLAFFTGLAWVVWGIDLASYRYQQQRLAGGEVSPRKPVWNPLDVEAWYYGRKSRGLYQSLTALVTYSLLFWVASVLLTQVGGCQEVYEMPAGGGRPQMIAQQVQIQKVIRKKYVINPFSAILFNVRDVDDVKLQLNEITQHAYTVGYGQGTGAGFAGGASQGKVRFIRLEYNGGDWDQDFGIGSDVNMLVEYGTRTGQKVAERTESRRISQLANFPPDKSPPLVYLTGQRNIDVSNDDVSILRDYLLNKHGMLFGDNGGSGHFHNQFVALMRRVLPQIDPVPVPLDDVIHRIPYPIPFLPYVAPHGGTQALGWKVDGRWVCYYHPGDIGDAWTDDHSGVSREVYEACYQLGTNVIFYAHVEYSKWLSARQQKK